MAILPLKTITHCIIYDGQTGTLHCNIGGRRGRDRMVVGFTTTYTSPTTLLEYRSWQGLLDATLCDKVFQ